VRLDDCSPSARKRLSRFCGRHQYRGPRGPPVANAGMAGQYMIQGPSQHSRGCGFTPKASSNIAILLIGPGELTIVITQSGETRRHTSGRAARSQSQRLAHNCHFERGLIQPLAREADGVLYTHAGP